MAQHVKTCPTYFRRCKSQITRENVISVRENYYGQGAPTPMYACHCLGGDRWAILGYLTIMIFRCQHQNDRFVTAGCAVVYNLVKLVTLLIPSSVIDNPQTPARAEQNTQKAWLLSLEQVVGAAVCGTRHLLQCHDAVVRIMLHDLRLSPTGAGLA